MNNTLTTGLHVSETSSFDNAVAAGIWGLISAFSLVIGAIVGVSFKVEKEHLKT